MLLHDDDKDFKKSYLITNGQKVAQQIYFTKMKSKRGKSFYPEVVIPGHAIDYVISRESSDVFICPIFSAQSISAQNNNFSTFSPFSAVTIHL